MKVGFFTSLGKGSLLPRTRPCSEGTCTFIHEPVSGVAASEIENIQITFILFNGSSNGPHSLVILGKNGPTTDPTPRVFNCYPLPKRVPNRCRPLEPRRNHRIAIFHSHRAPLQWTRLGNQTFENTPFNFISRIDRRRFRCNPHAQD